MSTPTPLFSVLTPVYDPPVDVLEDTIASVRAQTHDSWELILVDDRSTDPAVLQTLHRHAAEDDRIKVIERESNGHIVAASNDALAAARGEFVALLDHDDLLTSNALETYARLIAADDEIDYLYSDEDKVGADGTYYDVFRKPVWSPERLRGQNYVSHFSAIRTALVREVGGFREGYEGSQDHDLTLRTTERARRVVHVPEVLYHWRVVPGSAAGEVDAKPYAVVAGRNAVQDQVDRLGIDAEVVHGPVFGTYLLNRRLDPSVSVSLIIPTLGKSGLIWGRQRCFVVETVRTVLAKAGHENLEVVVVYDPPTPEWVLEELREIAGDRLRLVRFDAPFNFSEKMNVGALNATGDYFALLNDDLEAISEDWVPRLIGPLLEPDVGMTGAKLYFSNGTIQHVGHAYARQQYHHPFIFRDGTLEGPMRALLINREATGVTAACAGISRETYLDVGGFSELLPLNFNDVDLSYKVTTSGRRIVWVANVEMFHFESRTRKPQVEAWEKQTTVDRWGYPVEDLYLPGLYPTPDSSKRKRDKRGVARLPRYSTRG